MGASSVLDLRGFDAFRGLALGRPLSLRFFVIRLHQSPFADVPGALLNLILQRLERFRIDLVAPSAN